MSDPKFEIGEIVKANPVGLVKRISHRYINEHSGKWWYVLEDSIGHYAEFYLNKVSQDSVLSRSVAKANEDRANENITLKKQIQSLKAENEKLRKVLGDLVKNNHWPHYTGELCDDEECVGCLYERKLIQLSEGGEHE